MARVCAAEGIDAGLVKGGTLSVATSAAQDARLRQHLEPNGPGETDDGSFGISIKTNWPGGCRWPGPSAPCTTRTAPGCSPPSWWPGWPRRSPAPASCCTRGPRSRRSRPGARAPRLGDVRAPYVLRCTEGFTAELPGPAPDAAADEQLDDRHRAAQRRGLEAIGWDGCETLGDEAHAYMYAQRTADGRIALGGRGVPYRFGSGIDHDGAVRPSTMAQLGRILRRMFPVTAEAGIEHAWCGVLGVPRDWCATVTMDPRTGLGWAGGYTGHGVAAANLAGRTLADLVRGVPSPLTTLPWVGHRSPRWEPDPRAGPGCTACTPCTARRTGWNRRTARRARRCSPGRETWSPVSRTDPGRSGPAPRQARHRAFPAKIPRVTPKRVRRSS